MPHFEPNDFYYQESPGSVPLEDRPPQLNTTVCGCRCGCGCSLNGDSEGGSSDEEGAAVRIPQTFNFIPNMNLADETFPQSHQGPERPLTTPKVEVQSPMLVRRDGHDEQIQTPYGGFLMSREGFRPMECPLDLDDLRRMLLRGLHTINRAETPSSMTNEPDGSGDHSLASSTILSVRCGTPGPGLGGWTEEAPLLPNYHFLKSPLRLTPQRRYCRGLVAAHLVLDDDMTDHHNYPKSISGEHLADPELAVTNF